MCHVIVESAAYQNSHAQNSLTVTATVGAMRGYSSMTPHARHRHTRSARRDARTHPLIEADEPEYGEGRSGRSRPSRVARLVA